MLPANGALVEFGSGSSKKVRLLLRAAPHLAAYVPVDISAEFLREEAEGMRRDFPALTIAPVVADFMKPFQLPPEIGKFPRAGFFPGSTIGNFEPHQACTFLRHAGHMLGRGAVLIIGVDRVKDRAVLNAAYNDAEGVTAQFNRNVLARINRELGADFNLDAFEHHAFFNRELSRIEMHLASLKRQKVKVAGETIEFRAGETIHTENSYKYTVESFGALARGSGWTPLAHWTDREQYFSVHALSFKGESAKALIASSTARNACVARSRPERHVRSGAARLRACAPPRPSPHAPIFRWHRLPPPRPPSFTIDGGGRFSRFDRFHAIGAMMTSSAGAGARAIPDGSRISRASRMRRRNRRSGDIRIFAGAGAGMRGGSAPRASGIISRPSTRRSPCSTSSMRTRTPVARCHPNIAVAIAAILGPASFLATIGGIVWVLLDDQRRAWVLRRASNHLVVVGYGAKGRERAHEGIHEGRHAWWRSSRAPTEAADGLRPRSTACSWWKVTRATRACSTARASTTLHRSRSRPATMPATSRSPEPS